MTNEGILLRRRAEEILQLVDKTEKELVEQEEQVEGKISIGCGEIAAVQLLPKIIESFRRKYPVLLLTFYSHSRFGKGTNGEGTTGYWFAS